MSVKVYSTKRCPFCIMEKQYLRKNGVQYEDILLDENWEKAGEMVQKTGQMGVPVTIITDEAKKEHVIIGFDRPRLARLLQI